MGVDKKAEEYRKNTITYMQLVNYVYTLERS